MTGTSHNRLPACTVKPHVRLAWEHLLAHGPCHRQDVGLALEAHGYRPGVNGDALATLHEMGAAENPARGIWQAVPDEEPRTRITQAERVLAVLARHGPLEHGQIHALSGIPPRSLSATLSALKRQGVLKRLENGAWKPAKPD